MKWTSCSEPSASTRSTLPSNTAKVELGPDLIVLEDRQVLGPDPHHHRLVSVAPQRRSRGVHSLGQPDRLATDESGGRLLADRGLEEVHRRRSDEARHEQVGRVVVERLRAVALLEHAGAAVTATRSPMVIASTWSWVT